ncbi:hypothetical protein DY000_02030451 [Brassica cretica]|uniref:Uncharacterized protein n=1 Tax=Brassica cretica TaxID=69181 RepID=A0ABQ7DH51_BRACR|nr:hypothetical protein DY000_02030451 [Brassica cretica]
MLAGEAWLGETWLLVEMWLGSESGLMFIWSESGIAVVVLQVRTAVKRVVEMAMKEVAVVTIIMDRTASESSPLRRLKCGRGGEDDILLVGLEKDISAVDSSSAKLQMKTEKNAMKKRASKKTKIVRAMEESSEQGGREADGGVDDDDRDDVAF